MRRLAILSTALLPLALAAAGCGDRALVLTVNLLSFLDPSERTQPYGPIPANVVADFGVADEQVNLLEGLGDAVDAESASLRVRARFENATGSATGTIRIYVAAADTADPQIVPPIAVLPVTLAPAETTVVAAEVPSSPQLADALTRSSARIAVRISLDTTGSPAPLQGVETIEELVAIVVTKRSL